MNCKKRWKMHNFKACDSFFSNNEGRLHEQCYLVPNNAQHKIQQLWFITKAMKRKGNMSLKFSYQNICNRIQIENYLFLLQNNAETWICPWNWERWILLGSMKCFSPVLQYRLQYVLQSRTINVLKMFQYVSPDVTFKEQIS